MLRPLVSHPELTTARTRLRVPTLDDAEALHALYGDPESMRYVGHAPQVAVEQMREKLTRDLGAMDRGEAAIWVLTRREESRGIGYVVLFHWSQRDRRAELGYVLARSLWGQGLMKEVLPEVVRFGFEHMRLNRIEAHVDPFNTASLRLLDGLGFRREGQLRESCVYPDGRYADTVVLGLLAREAPLPAPR